MTASVKARFAAVMGAAAIAVAACGSSDTSGTGNSSSGSSNTANPNETAPPDAVDGGTLNLGVWQEPSSFLDAGIADSLTFSYLIDAPVQEGLLWYRSADQTATAKTIADYWQPWLATEVPTTANGDVKTSGCKDNAAKMCVTWKLRDGVTWHDGSSFTSHDVCDTYQFFFLKYGAKNPTTILTTSGWDQVTGCTEDNPHQATVSYKTVFGPYLTLGSGVYGVLPAKLLDAAFAAGASEPDHHDANLQSFKQTVDLTVGSNNPDAFKGTGTLDLIMDGTGPYVFKKYEAGKSVQLVPNKNYWGAKALGHKPHLAAMNFKIEADITAELNAAKAGDIDMGFDFRLYNLKALIDESANGKLKVQTIPDSGAEKIDFNLCDNAKGLCGAKAQKSPYAGDLTIRQAIIKALDRESYVQNQAAGRTTVPHDAWQYLGIEFALDNGTNPKTTHDAAGANKILDDAGYAPDPKCGADPKSPGGSYRHWKDGSCIALNLGTTSSNPSRVATESLVAADLDTVGIKVKTPFAPNLSAGQFFGSFKDGGPLYTHQFDMAMYTNTVSAPAEFDSYGPGYHADCGGTCPELNQIPSDANSGQGQNDTAENNPAVDKALDAGRATVDLTERAKQYKTVEQNLAHDLPEIPLYQQVTVDSYSTQLRGLKDNDLVWDYNAFDWYCTAGKCQAS